MSARSIRRAAERQAQKLAAKAGLPSSTAAAQQPLAATAAAGTAFAFATDPAEEQPSAETPQPNPISEAKLAANRQNGQKSHGAVTDAGKAKSKLNAVKHGLTSAHVLFANPADAQLYARHAEDYQYFYQPVGPEERALVQSITDIRWRLSTCPVLEFAVIAKGTATIVDTNSEFWNRPENQNELFLEAHRQNDREIRNLQLQENRLARRCERDTARLERLQKGRKEAEAYNMAQAAKSCFLQEHLDPAKVAAEGYSVPGVGFDFSAERFQAYSKQLTPAQKQKLFEQALAATAA